MRFLKHMSDHRSLLSVDDLDDEELRYVLRRSAEIKADRSAARDVLADRCVGIYFQETSTRTRTSFTIGAELLGARTILYGPYDLQLNTGECGADTGRVLGGYLDALVVRTREARE